MKKAAQKTVLSKSLMLNMICSMLALAVFGFTTQTAEACNTCVDMAGQRAIERAPPDITNINNHVTDSFEEHRDWILNTLWKGNILPAMRMMAEQLSAVAEQQVMIIGTFMDAEHQLQTQQVLQRIQARTHKDYHPSEGMCEFGSTVKSLAASERKAEYTAIVLAQRAQDRNLGNAYSASATGEDSDSISRIRQYREKFCDPMDNNNGLQYLCEHDQDGNPGNGPVGAAKPERKNKDIDFARTVDAAGTLDMDFTDDVLTDNEEEVIALANNLYGHHVFRRPPSATLRSDPNGLSVMQKHYMDMRAVLAKQSVAENSFNEITAMKAQGTAGSRDFMAAIFAELGVPVAEIGALFGDKPGFTSSPSYDAQMEVLTKKIYQNPDFYTNLYDKPANVDRKGVALQAIGLMQKFDLFKSYLRNEASLSVLLELAVMDLQEEMESQFGRMESGGDPAPAP